MCIRDSFPYYLQMILSFNPISITHWLKKRFFDVPDPRARVHESTYRDTVSYTHLVLDQMKRLYPNSGRLLPRLRLSNTKCNHWLPSCRNIPLSWICSAVSYTHQMCIRDSSYAINP